MTAKYQGARWKYRRSRLPANPTILYSSGESPNGDRRKEGHVENEEIRELTSGSKVHLHTEQCEVTTKAAVDRRNTCHHCGTKEALNMETCQKSAPRRTHKLHSSGNTQTPSRNQTGKKSRRNDIQNSLCEQREQQENECRLEEASSSCPSAPTPPSAPWSSAAAGPAAQQPR